MDKPSISRTTRVAVGLVALAGFSLSAFGAVQHYRQRAALRLEVETSGLMDRRPEAAAAALRDVDPYWGRLKLARALVLEVMDRTAPNNLGSRLAALEATMAPRRLAQAHGLAEEATAARPVVWQGWLFKGASTYLAWFRALDERLFTERQVWAGPLDRAVELAPGRLEPQRVVAGIAIDLWPTYDDDERALATDQIGQAFQNLPTLKSFIVAWLTVAEDPFAVIPENADSWSEVSEAARRLGMWPTFCEARSRWSGIRKAEAPRLLARIEWLADHGERLQARREFVHFVAQTPTDLFWAPEVQQAVMVLPPGVPGYETERAFRPWLTWGLEAAVRRVEFLTPEALLRLSAGFDALPAPEHALIDLLAGRTDQAMRTAGRFDDLNTERWAQFGLIQTRFLLAQNRVEEARRSWSRVHPVVRNAPFAVDVGRRFEVGSERTVSADEPVGRLQVTAWRWDLDEAFVDLPAFGGKTILHLTWDVVPAAGAVVDVSVDFRSVWSGVVQAGETTKLSIDKGHQSVHLRVKPVAGGRTIPGAVEWAPEPTGLQGEEREIHSGND